MKFVATKKGIGMTKNFSPLFCCCFWIRDPGWVKIRIRDEHPGSATLVTVTASLDHDGRWSTYDANVRKLGKLSEAEFLDVIGAWEKSLNEKQGGSGWWEIIDNGLGPW
jgi:hypothetical protein